MSNPFDQFDEGRPSAAQKNPFDQFDAPPPPPAMSMDEVPVMAPDELTSYNARRASETNEPAEPGLGGRVKDLAADWGMGSGDVATGLGQLVSVPETAFNEGVAKVMSAATGEQYSAAQPIGANALRDIGGETTEFYADKKSDYSNARVQDIANADGFTGKVKAYIDNPSQILSGAVRSLPSFVGPAAATRMVSAQNATKAAIAAGGAVEGAASGGETYHNVMDMTFEQLVEGSPDFAALLKQDIPPSEAKLILANRAGLTAQAIQTPLSILTSKAMGTGKIDAEFFTDPMAKTFTQVLKELPSNTVRQGAEEMTQEVTGQGAVNIAEQTYADKNKQLTEGMDDAAAGGLMLGASQAAGMSGVNAMFANGSPTQDLGVDMPVNGESLIDQEATQDPLQLEHKPQRMIVMPDGTTAWESEIPSVQAGTENQKIISKHPAYPRLTETPESIEQSLDAPISVDDEINQLLREQTDYRAQKVLSRSPIASNFNDGELNPISGNGTPGLSEEFIQQRQSAQEAEKFWNEQQQIKNTPIRSESPAIDYTEEDSALFGEPRRLMDQTSVEPIVNRQPVSELSDFYPPETKLVPGKADARVDASIPAGMNDARLTRPEYRSQLERAARELVQGGGVSFVRDSNDRIVGRTPSINPDWFKSANENPDVSMSVVHAKSAIQKALAGEKLGVREARIVGAALDHITGERGQYVAELIAKRQLARDARKAAFDSWKAETNVPDDADFISMASPEKAGETYTETDYEVDLDYDDRAVAELVDHAVTMGADWKQIDAALELSDIDQQSKALTNLIWSARNEHRQTKTKPTNAQSGSRQGAQASRSLAEEAPNAPPEIAPNALQEPSPSAGVSVSSEPEIIDGDSSEIDQLKARLAGKTKDEKLLEFLLDVIEIGTDTMNDGGWPSASIKPAIELSKRIQSAMDSDDYSSIMDDASQTLREILKNDDFSEFPELTAIEKQLSQFSLDATANEAATSPTNNLPEPTEAQKEAGNYKKGHVRIHGLDIAIENPKGSIRSGTDSKGKKWEVEMHSHYGYIKKTEGADGDHVDVFVGPNPESEKIFIVDQINPDGSFDEHKVMLGYDSPLRAKTGYSKNYSKGWKVGPITSMSVDDFKDWLKNGDTKKPVSTSVTSGVATAPEHKNNVGKKLDESTVYPKPEDPAKEQASWFNPDAMPLTIDKDDFLEITNEWSDLFTNDKTVRANDYADDYVSKLKAKTIIDKWKARVKEQFNNNRSENSDKTILSLFDLSGEWSKPWKEAGYNVITFDIQTGQDVMDFDVEYFTDNWDFGEVYGILAACPCTDFASSGARHFEAKDADGRTEASKELVFQTLRTIEFFKPKIWALENPVGRIERLTGLPKAKYIFDPHHFGETYTKKTMLWGRFNPQLPTANVDPVEGSKMHKKYGGKSQATKNARSVTPEGFAYSFFMANNYIDMPADMRLELDYPMVSGAVKSALKAGVSEERIHELMEDTYGNYEYDEARQALLDEIAGLDNNPQSSTDYENLLNDKFEKAKKSISSDIKNGVIAGNVNGFSDLHDYVDANQYVNDASGERLIGKFGKANGWKTEDYTKFTNAIIKKLDEWIRAEITTGNDLFADLPPFKVTHKLKSDGTLLMKLDSGGYVDEFGDRYGDVKTDPIGDEIKKASKTKEAASKKAEKIDDVGDQLAYNKKENKFLKWDDIKDENETLKVKLAEKKKVWPKPEWENIIESIPEKNREAGKLAAYMVKQVYDSIPTKPAKTDDASIAAYIEVLTDAREAADKLLNDVSLQYDLIQAIAAKAERRSLTTIQVSSLGKDKPILNYMLDAVLPMIGSSRWAKGTPQHLKGQMIGSKAIDAMQFSVRAGVKAIKAIEAGWPAKQEAWQRQGYKIAKQEGEPVATTAPKAGSNEHRAKVTLQIEGSELRLYGNLHPSEQEAIAEAKEIANKHNGDYLLINKRGSILGAYASESEAADAARERVNPKETQKEAKIEAINIESDRHSVHRENNRNVTPEELKEVFNFRGVNFGNWVNQKERQSHINRAFDALHDLANVIGVPPKAIGLGGKLGIAFGAQGGGKAAAHFVPGANEINITKTAGAGSVAHEWAHALDHHFGSLAGKGRDADPYASHLSDHKNYTGEIRPEIGDIFKSIVREMKSQKETMLEAIARNEKALNQAKASVADTITQMGLRKSSESNPELAELVQKIEAGDTGEYVPLNVKKKSKYGLASAPENIKKALEIFGFTQEQIQLTYINLNTVALYKDQKVYEQDLRNIHTEFYRKSSEKDGTKTPYWSTSHEMFARAFEAFVMDRMDINNDYLVHPVKADQGKTDPAYPYPAGSERQLFNQQFDKLIDEIKVKENDSGNPILFSLGKGENTQTKTEASSENKITKSEAEKVVENISKNWAVDVSIKIANTVDDFPERIKSQLHSANDKKINALFDQKTNEIWINLDQVHDAETVERMIFHEVYTHLGLRGLFGSSVTSIMGKLYMQIGGQKAVRDLAEKYGMNLKAYEEAYKDQPRELSYAIIAEELLAHMAEHHKPFVVRTAQELVGAIRAWLRKNGFMNLSKITESDMRYLLKQSREVITKGKPGDVLGLIYTLSDASKEDRKEINAMFSLPPESRKVIGSDPLLAAWTMLSQHEEAFSYPTSKAKTLPEVFQDVRGPAITVERYPRMDEKIFVNGKPKDQRVWKIKQEGNARYGLVFETDDNVWIDVLAWGEGGGGSHIYNAVANYAYNSGKTFIGDPAGLSDASGMTRRLENMISSALKFGTTDHLWPHDKQLEGNAYVPAIKWKDGDFENNLKELITASYEATKRQFPEIENLSYDFDRNQFVHKDGDVWDETDFKREAESTRSNQKAAVGSLGNQSGRPSFRGKITAGGKTLRRAVVTQSVLRGTSSERSKLLVQLSRELPEHLKGILYSIKDDKKETRSGGFSFGQSKNRGATLPHQLREAYKQLGGANKTFFEKVKTETKRQLAPRGLLPREIFDLKIARDGAMNAADSQQRFILNDFYEQIQKVYQKPYHELKASTRKEIDDYLKGDRKQVKLTKSVVDVLARMRAQIQSLSNAYIDELLLDAANLESEGKPEEAQQKRDLIETIVGNYDNYLHRSYRAFDDPDWPKKVPEDVYQAAVNYLAKQYDGDVKAAAKKVDLILHEGTAYDSMGRFISESKLGSKDLSVLKTRKQIAPEIRALLGEYEDPAVNYAKSATKMTRLVNNTAFLRQMKDAAIDLGLLFDESNRPLGAHKKIAGDASDVYSPLNGMYTYPEFAQALQDAVGGNKEPDWYKALVAANGAVKYGKTVLAPTTAVRNFLSASMFSLTSGHWDVTELSKSAKVVKTYFTGKDVRGSREYINKLLKLGVLYDAPNYRELQDLIKSVNESEHWLAQATRKSKVGTVLNYAQEFYALGDDFWKIMGFENEKAMLMKQHKMSEAEAEKEAAERIRNTYPTYSLTGKGIQTLRRFPVVGAFPSFPAEIIRTTYHKFRYFHQDAKALGYDNPAVIAKGVGLAIGAGMMAGISAMSAAILGIDDDEEEAIRQMLPEWSRNSSLFFLGRDEDGHVQYMDLGWLDPYAYWKKPLSALARDGDAGDRAKDAVWEALSPFIGLDIAAGELVELFDNIRDTGVTAEKTAATFAKGLAPGVWGNITGFWNAADQTVTKSGKKYTFEDEALALLGFRKGTLNAKVGLTYQAYGYLDQKRAAAKTLRDVATDMSKVDLDDMRSAYERSMKMHNEAWNDMRRTVKIAMKAGLTKSEAIAALRTSGVSKRDAAMIVDDMDFSYRPSKAMMKLAIRRTAILFDEESAAQMQERAKQMQELQKEYMEKPIR